MYRLQISGMDRHMCLEGCFEADVKNSLLARFTWSECKWAAWNLVVVYESWQWKQHAATNGQDPETIFFICQRQDKYQWWIDIRSGVFPIQEGDGGLQKYNNKSI